MSGFGRSGVAAGVMALAVVWAVGQVSAAPADAEAAAEPAKAAATLVDAEGKSIGQVVLTQAPDGVLVKATVTGLKPGSYGFHLHTTGKCETPGYASAGGHWNPTAHQHGKENPQGPHMGDLPNLEVAASGMGTLEQKIAGAWIQDGDHPLLDADGAAAVLHAGPDDYKTDPAGNSGARIACGVIDVVK